MDQILCNTRKFSNQSKQAPHSTRINKAAHRNQFTGINIKNVRHISVILKTFDGNENNLQCYFISNRRFCTNAA